jgi:uncharacterized membrane protein
LLFEGIALLIIIPIFKYFSNEKSLYFVTLFTIFISTLTMVWSIVFNSVFERLEARRKKTTRTVFTRVVHAIGFEASLVLIVVPISAYGLGITFWQAFMLEFVFFLIFPFYTFLFQWVFDTVFDLPEGIKK